MQSIEREDPKWMVDGVRNRLKFFCNKAEEVYGEGDYGMDQGTLAQRVWDVWAATQGYHLPEARHGIANWVIGAGPDEMRRIIQGIYLVLRDSPRMGIDRDWFERMINETLTDGHISFRLVDGKWKVTADTEADDLLRQVLLDRSDVAGCQRGDVQVEMVASSAQVRLGAGATIVDYGAGLGRVGDGLSTAGEFAFARYVAVDSPVRPDLRSRVESFGPNCTTVEREEFLRSGGVKADVVLVVNTLHHVPFADIPRQFGILLRSLQPGGILVLHEMGSVEPPEQRNVPWSHDAIASLLTCDGLRVNARSTASKGKGVPLAHIVVHANGSLDGIEEQLAQTSGAVWRDMKEKTLARIATLYSGRDASAVPALRLAMIQNANLDLNPPIAASRRSH